jgi:uncharacterized protein (DUF433 family)
MVLDPEHLFRLAGLEPGGIADWSSEVPSKSSGVYIITTDQTHVVITARDPQHHVSEREIVYIGRASHLSQRLRQFRSHRHGAKSPHRGGQDILLLKGPLKVHWAEAEDYKEAEARLIRLFAHYHAGKLPFGNKVRPRAGAKANVSPAGEVTLAERIVAEVGVCGGRARIAGTRMRVVDIVAALCAGDTIEEILEDFPEIAREDVRAAVEYAVAELERPAVTSGAVN